MTPSIEELLECSFILIDKPVGPSSHEVTTYVKRLTGARRTGHAGTLDPQVSGVLVVGLNRATRLIRFITEKEKTYVGVLRLRTPPSSIRRLQVEMDRHIGDIRQLPPKMSAVAKRVRTRKVFEFKALELEKNTALFISRVEAGTYIRVLCNEVGKPFAGGKMIQLRRTAVGPITEKRLVRLPQLADALWQWREKNDEQALRAMLISPLELVGLPRIWLNDEGMGLVSRGAPLAREGVAQRDENLAPGQFALLLGSGDEIIGIGKIERRESGAHNDKGAIVARSAVVLAKPRD